MGQCGGLNLKDVVRHQPGGDASLRRMYAPHCVLVEASTDGRSKKSAIAIDGRSGSGDRMVLPLSTMSEVSGMKTVLLPAK